MICNKVWILNVNYSYWLRPLLEIQTEYNIAFKIFGIENIGREINENKIQIEYENMFYAARGSLKPDSRYVYNEFNSWAEIYSKYYNFDLMCENFQINDGEFSSINRQDLFLRLTHHFISQIETEKPSVIISNDVPHNVYDYVVYLLASVMGVPFYIIRPFPNGYSGVCQNLKVASIIPICKKQKIERYNNLTVDKSYMDWQYCMLRKIPLHSIFLSFAMSFKDRWKKGIIKSFKDDKSGCVSLKVKPLGQSTSSPSSLMRASLRIKAMVGKLKLRNEYNKLSIDELTKKSKKIVVIFLSYQPEATTMPLADLYANQVNMVLKVKSTFSDYEIYIKEHPSQFLVATHSNTSRPKNFYYDLVNRYGLMLVSQKISSDELIELADVVVTTTGTVGYESILKGKITVHFGDTWYSDFPRVVSGKKTRKEILEFVNCNDNKDADLILKGIKSKYTDLFSKLIPSQFHVESEKFKINELSSDLRFVLERIIKHSGIYQ